MTPDEYAERQRDGLRAAIAEERRTLRTEEGAAVAPEPVIGTAGEPGQIVTVHLDLSTAVATAHWRRTPEPVNVWRSSGEPVSARVWRSPTGENIYAPYVRSLDALRAARGRLGWVTLTHRQVLDWMTTAIGSIVVEDLPHDAVLIALNPHPAVTPTERPEATAIRAFADAVEQMSVSLASAVSRFSAYAEEAAFNATEIHARTREELASRESYRSVEAWNDAAETAFLARLTPAERHVWEAHRYVDLCGSLQHDCYRITYAVSGNITRHRDLMRLCTQHHNAYAPAYVMILCQYRLLQLDEPTFLSKCNTLGPLAALPHGYGGTRATYMPTVQPVTPVVNTIGTGINWGGRGDVYRGPNGDEP